MTTLRGWVVRALGMAALILAQGAAAQEDRPAMVQADPVVVESMSQTAPVIGRLVALQASVVAARVDGPVLAVHVEVGDRVERGDVLAELDVARLQAEYALRQAEVNERMARLEAARAELALARQALDRLTGLRDSAAFSQGRFDDARAEVNRYAAQAAEVDAGLASARVALDLAQIELDDARIRAPFSGVVSERHVDEGEYVRIGDPVIRIINDLDLEVEAAVPADRLAGLTPGRAVTIVLDDGSTHEAAVRAIVPREDPQTRTRTVRFTPAFGEMERALASNQSVIVRVPVGQPRPVVTVDKDAVIARQDDRVVYVIEDGRAQPRTVTLGAAVGSRFEVLGGLDPGELVVVRGNERLQPGQPVDYRQGS